MLLDSANEQMAMFRYSVICPLFPEDRKQTLSDRIKVQAERVWMLPDGTLRQYGFSTIEQWFYRYKSEGVDGLLDLPRRDSGTFPGMPEDAAVRAMELFTSHADTRNSTVYRLLEKEGLVVDGKPSKSTFYRWANTCRPKEQTLPGKERLAFEAEFPNKLWQADLMYGPMIPKRQPNGRKKKMQTYLVAVIDDHSRLICGAGFFFTQGIECWVETLRQAICRRGIPQKLYCDNGKIFTSAQIKRIGAILGMQVLHTPVRDGAAKGKIERFFRTVRDGFLGELELTGMSTDIDALNRSFRSWLETHYNNAVHSAHGSTPQERWIANSRNLRIADPDEIETHFLFETQRKVRKDGTFSLNSTRYETISALAGKTITLRYEPIKLTRIDVWYDNQYHGRANLLDLHANNRRQRKGPQS